MPPSRPFIPATALIALFALVGSASAQTLALSPAATAERAAIRIGGEHRSADVPASPRAEAATYAQAWTRPHHRCCGLKGAVIGAAIGAGLGWWIVAHICDAGDCTSEYVKYMVVLGGVGGGLGALAHRSPSWRPMPERRFQIRGLAARRFGGVQLSF
jgi:hypothetical protein